MARGLACAVHVHPSPIPQEKHHIWPKGYHGPTEPGNLLLICCNAHSDIHYYMDYMLKHNGSRPTDWRTYGPLVRTYAVLGYERVMSYAKTLTKDS